MPSGVIVGFAELGIFEDPAAYGHRTVVARDGPPVNVGVGRPLAIGVVHVAGPVEHRRAKGRTYGCFMGSEQGQRFQGFFLGEIGQVACMPFQVNDAYLARVPAGW